MRQCPLCRHENENGARFCVECGEHLRITISEKYVVHRDLPVGLDPAVLHDRLLSSLKEMGYEILHGEMPVRTTKGTRSAGYIDSRMLLKYLESLWEPRRRAFTALDIKHWLAITFHDSSLRFEFRIDSSGLIDLALTERHDKIEMENIADRLMMGVLGLAAEKPDVRALRARISNWIRLYKDLTNTRSFVRMTLFFFMFPIVVQSAAKLMERITPVMVAIYGVNIDEVTVPPEISELKFSLAFHPSVWYFQLLFLVVLTCLLMSASLVVEHKIKNRLVNYFGALRNSYGTVHSRYLFRDALRQLDVSPIRWTTTRFLFSTIGAIMLVAPLIFVSEIDRGLSLVASLLGFWIVTSSCSTASYGRVKQLAWRRAMANLWFFIALGWLMVWYDAYIISLVLFSIEMRELWFLSTYTSGVATLMACFVYWELKENGRNIYKVLIGKAPHDISGLGVRSAVTLGLYAIAIGVLEPPLPVIPSNVDPGIADLVQTANEFIISSRSLFMDTLSLLPSIVFLVVFARFLWARRLRVHVSIKKVTGIIMSEGLSLVTYRGKEVLVFVLGLLLLLARAYGLSANVVDFPEPVYATSGFAGFVAFLLIVVACYRTSHELVTV